MFNVLVADDDANIRKGLKILAPWEEYGFSIIESAADGKEALEKYKKQSFDLLVIDIQMPKMDGLELIATIRKMDPFVHFLVLSGHADFEYARKSIEWKVDGYLLKPIEEEKLIEYLKKIEATLKKEREDKLFTMGENIWRCEMLIQSVLSGTVPADGEDIEEKASQIGLLWPSYQVLLIEQEDSRWGESGSEVKLRLRQAFNKNSQGVVFWRESFLGILLNGSITGDQALKLLYDGLAQIIGLDGRKFFAAIGESVRQIKDIAKSYETASKLLKNRFIADKRTILSMNSISFLNKEGNQSSSPGNFDIQSAAGKLYYALDVGSKETVGQLIGEWENKMIEYGCSEKTIKTNFMQIVSIALNKLAQSSPVIQQKVQEFLSGLAEIYNQPDLSSLQSFMLQQLSNIIEYIEGGNNQILVKKMIGFMERNYNSKLTLEICADMFNYNTGYLGRLFKKYTGENFNTYLDKVRILKAKELLLQGIKVYEVAKLIGYSNVDYFHSKFRKYAGVSPSQFRKEKI